MQAMAVAALVALAVPSRAETGYVVRVESGTAWFDLGDSSGAAPGREFLVFSEGAELKHPVTGETLGRVERPVASGRLETAAARWSTGRFEGGTPEAGMRVRLRQSAAPPDLAAPPAAEAAPSDVPSWRSPTAEMEAVDLAEGDVDGDGRPDIVLADATRVRAFPQEGVPSCAAGAPCSPWLPSCAYEDKHTGARILSLDALDLDRDGRAEVFATVHDSVGGRVETRVLQCAAGALVPAATLPEMTRAYQDADGAWRLAAQELVADRTFPFGNLHDIEWRGGRYAAGKSLRAKRLEWIYGFGLAKDAQSSEPFHMFLSPTSGRLRLQFGKGSWTSPEAYGQTASRLRWHDRLLHFHPRFGVSAGPGGLTGVYALRNVAGLGGLAGPFGVFSNSEIHRLRWTGLALEPEWKAELGGYAAGMAYRAPAGGKPGQILVAVVGKGGRTAVVRFPAR